MWYQANTISLYPSTKASCLAVTNFLWLICVTWALKCSCTTGRVSLALGRSGFRSLCPDAGCDLSMTTGHLGKNQHQNPENSWIPGCSCIPTPPLSYWLLRGVQCYFIAVRKRFWDLTVFLMGCNYLIVESECSRTQTGFSAEIVMTVIAKRCLGGVEAARCNAILI